MSGIMEPRWKQDRSRCNSRIHVAFEEPFGTLAIRSTFKDIPLEIIEDADEGGDEALERLIITPDELVVIQKAVDGEIRNQRALNSLVQGFDKEPLKSEEASNVNI